MSDSKKLNEEQLKNVAGGAGSLENEPINGSGYEKDGEWIPSDN